MYVLSLLFLCHIMCVGKCFTPEHGGGGGWGRVQGSGPNQGLTWEELRSKLGYLGNWHLHPRPGQARGPVRGQEWPSSANPKAKERQTGKFRMGKPEDPLTLVGNGGSLFTKSWGPVNGGSLLGSLPSYDRGDTIPKSKGIFTLAAWLVFRMEKTFSFFVPSPRPSCLCHGQFRAVVGFLSLNRTDSQTPRTFAPTPDGLFHPPASGGGCLCG